MATMVWCKPLFSVNGTRLLAGKLELLLEIAHEHLAVITLCARTNSSPKSRTLSLLRPLTLYAKDLDSSLSSIRLKKVVALA